MSQSPLLTVFGYAVENIRQRSIHDQVKLLRAISLSTDDVNLSERIEQHIEQLDRANAGTIEIAQLLRVKTKGSHD